jgi:hypothetical protein
MDLQREADKERPWTVKSEEESVRLEQFRQGRLDRWGRPTTSSTNISDFYRDAPERGEPW